MVFQKFCSKARQVTQFGSGTTSSNFSLGRAAGAATAGALAWLPRASRRRARRTEVWFRALPGREVGCFSLDWSFVCFFHVVLFVNGILKPLLLFLVPCFWGFVETEVGNFLDGSWLSLNNSNLMTITRIWRLNGIYSQAKWVSTIKLDDGQERAKMIPLWWVLCYNVDLQFEVMGLFPGNDGVCPVPLHEQVRRQDKDKWHEHVSMSWEWSPKIEVCFHLFVFNSCF